MLLNYHFPSFGSKQINTRTAQDEQSSSHISSLVKNPILSKYSSKYIKLILFNRLSCYQHAFLSKFYILCLQKFVIIKLIIEIFRYDICNIFNKKKIHIKNTVNERKTLKTGVVYFEFVSPIVNLAKASTIMKNTKSRME